MWIDSFVCAGLIKASTNGSVEKYKAHENGIRLDV